MDQMQSVSIIIPNYNGDKLLNKNIPQVVKAADYFQKKAHQKIEIILVDDASTDESLAVLYYLFEKFGKTVPMHILQNEVNLGFSSTVNKGAKKANGEFLVLLNSDVRPSEEFLLPLITHFSDENVFAVGCMDKSIEGGEIVLRGRGIGHWRKGLFIHSAGHLDKTSTMWVSGGSGMFRTSVWEELGGFNELFNPYYWEDIDLSYRAQKAGYSVLFEKESVVTHKHEEGAIKSSASKQSINTTAFRNQFIFIWTNLSDNDLLMSHFFFLPMYIIKAVIRFDIPFIFGFFKALLLLPAILTIRNKTKKHAARADKSLTLLS